MKRKALVSSILTLAICLALIAGSTFALFTSETFIDVEVDAGRVKIDAGLTEPTLYSVLPVNLGNGEVATEFDENGKGYVYHEQVGKFYNGGTAVLDPATGEIHLDNVTPGDKIVFNLTGANTSNVAVQYRYRFEVTEGYELMSGFVCTVEGTKYASMATYTSEWNELDVGENINKYGKTGIELALELPVSAGNYYQEKSATIKLYVEAIQKNADISDTDAVSVKYITTASDSAEFAAKLAADEYLHIFLDNSVNEQVVVNFNLKDKTIDANGNNINLKLGVDENNPITLENVVIKNVVDVRDDVSAITTASGVSGDLTVVNCEFGGKGSGGSIPKLFNGGGKPQDRLSVTVDDCRFYGEGANHAFYLYHVEDLVIRNSKFYNSKSWAINVNGNVYGNLVVSNCEFHNCVGILKASTMTGQNIPGDGALSGNLTFANNVIENCSLKNNVYIDVDPIYGEVTFSNNVMDGVVVTKEDMKGIVQVTNP